MQFKVKRDFLQIFLISMLLALIFACTIIYFTSGIGYLIVVVVIAVAVLSIYATAVIFASCKVEENTLTFRTGIFKYVIDLSKIVKVTPVTNYYFSLSLSKDRLRILTYDENGKQKVYYISVSDNEKLAALITPKTKVEVEKLEAAEVSEIKTSADSQTLESTQEKKSSKKEATPSVTKTKSPAKKTSTATKKKPTTSAKKTAGSAKSSTTDKKPTAKKTISKNSTKTKSTTKKTATSKKSKSNEKTNTNDKI